MFWAFISRLTEILIFGNRYVPYLSLRKASETTRNKLPGNMSIVSVWFPIVHWSEGILPQTTTNTLIGMLLLVSGVILSVFVTT